MVKYCLPKGRTLSSESVSLSVLSSTRKSGQFQDILTIPSDSCNRTWASIRPWQSITITWPSAVPNKTWRGAFHIALQQGEERCCVQQEVRGGRSYQTGYLLIIRCPDATCDLTLQVDLRGPVSLSADRADQHEAVPVRDERLSTVMWPGEVTHLEEGNDINDSVTI